MQEIFIRSKYNPTVFNSQQSVDNSEIYKIDFNQWSGINGNISSVSWSTIYGSITISNETLANNVASALVTFNGTGRVLIKIKATATSEVKTIWLAMLVKDPVFISN